MACAAHVLEPCQDTAAAEADRLEELGDEIATLAAHLHAASHRFLLLVAEYDERRGWEPCGFRSCAHWLAFRTGIDLGAAREQVRSARALVGLPQISAAMARGELSFSKLRCLTRVARPETEGELLEFARVNTAAQLESLVRGWRLLSRADEAARERARHAARRFSVVPDEDGMYRVRGRLEPEVGALLMRALDAAGDALYREPAARELDPAQRRADAVGLLAERALAAGFGGGEGGEDADGGAPGSVAAGEVIGSVAGEADGGAASDAASEAIGGVAGDVAGEAAGEAIVGVAGRTSAPISGSRAERYQVVLHVEAATLASAAGEEPGRSELEDGTRVSAETSRRLACDASVVKVTRSRDGSVLDVGRRTRTIPPALRRALEARDRGCRFPGCGLRFTDAHHVVHWADGGETKLGNTILLCRAHHRLVHEDGWRVELNAWPGGRPTFYDARGLPLPDRPPPPPTLPRQPVDALIRANRLHGATPGALTCSARYRRESDVPVALFLRVLECLPV
jgi:hypothetical protein